MSLKPSATIRYTAMRIGIFAGCFFAIWGLVYVNVLPSALGNANLLWVLMLAIVISAPLSFVLLRKQRDDMSAHIVGRIDRAKQQLSANQRQEDGADRVA